MCSSDLYAIFALQRDHMSIAKQLQSVTSGILDRSFGIHLQAEDIPVNDTKPEFEGDYTLVLFGLTKMLKRNPETLGKELGEALLADPSGLVSQYNLIKGFLNVTIAEKVLKAFLLKEFRNSQYGQLPPQIGRAHV